MRILTIEERKEIIDRLNTAHESLNIVKEMADDFDVTSIWIMENSADKFVLDEVIFSLEDTIDNMKYVEGNIDELLGN